MIQVDDPRKEYDGLVAVDDGDLRPAGAERGGEVDHDPVAAKSVMGIVPREVALYEDLPAEENLRLWAQACGLRRGRATERVRVVLETVGLADRGGDRVETFSGVAGLAVGWITTRTFRYA